ncbi:hypothetical protein SLEP1_g47957 [Rubroshorea leprosula]|uniref:Uncharacterized protein n=1 Tax=Rubroshorea leprosula TaxID=152421 RepID=A0AAV5LT25_9ROSI|nr:hypothetical protein SLEP1_g47957 [Rubroshorea leprosula]
MVLDFTIPEWDLSTTKDKVSCGLKAQLSFKLQDPYLKLPNNCVSWFSCRATGEDLRKLVDPKLGDNYTMDEVFKVRWPAHLARACTQENPQHRPSMRSIVVALATLSSSNEDWDIESIYENKALVNQMSER